MNLKFGKIGNKKLSAARQFLSSSQSINQLEKKTIVALVFDIGGTFIKSACINCKGDILFEDIFESEKSKTKLTNQIASAVKKYEKLCKQKQLKIIGLGLGVPGIVNAKLGVVYESPHFPTWKNFNIVKSLKSKSTYPIYIDNDANFAALGEGWKGNAIRCLNYVVLTLGTGIGAGIVINGNIWQGDSGFAGELGHLCIHVKGRKCACGGRGCLECYASASGLEMSWNETEKSPFLGSEGLFKVAKKNDKRALQLWKDFGYALGTGLASLVNVLGIESLFIGGGLSEALDLYSAAIKQGMKEHLYASSFKRVKMAKAKLGNHAGVLGAARVVFERNERFEYETI